MADSSAPQPMRTLSRESCAPSRPTESAFSDFLSDGSDEEDEEDADTRKLLRMQQQADDRTYVDAPFKLEADDSSFRLTLRRPGGFDGHEAAEGPRKLLLDQVPKSEEDEEGCQAKTVDDVMDAASAMERASRVLDEHLSLNCSEAVGDQSRPSTEMPRRKTSNRETEGAFADFLSDGSNSSEEEDADTRKLLRMQLQADDCTYVDASFKVQRPPVVREDNSHSFRLTLSRPGAFDSEEAWSGPKKLVQEPMGHLSAASEASVKRDEGRSFVGDRPSFSDVSSFIGVDVAKGERDGHESLASRPPSFDAEGDSFFDERRPSFSDEHSFTAAESFADNSFVYRPSLPDDDDEAQSRANEQVPSNSFADSSFVYRPTLPGKNDESPAEVLDCPATRAITYAAGDSSVVYRPDSNEGTKSSTYFGCLNSESSSGNAATQADGTVLDIEVNESEPSFLSPSATSFIGSNDAVAFSFESIDSSFVMPGEGAVNAADDSFSSVLTDSCASSAPPQFDTTAELDITPPEQVAMQQVKQEPAAISPSAAKENASSHSTPLTPKLTATDKNDSLPASAHDPVQPPLSRQSSVSSTSSSQDPNLQRRMTATRASWRVSSLDFQDSKHAFDEELGPLADNMMSPRASAVSSDQQRHRLSSTFEERNSVESASSNSSSFTSFHSQANFFVDDLQQSFSSVSSLPLDSRTSVDDSFTNVAILGDDVRDQNERRSSDIVSQDVREHRSSSVSVSFPTVSDSLDRSYSNLVDTAGLDRSFSKLVDLEGLSPLDVDRSSNGSATGTLGLSAISQSSAASDELSFASFSVAKPPVTAEEVWQPLQQEVKHVSAVVDDQDRQKLANEPEQVSYRSIVLPRDHDVKAIRPSRSRSVSSALLALIKNRDARTDTRSEETEAGDVAFGALPPLAPALKTDLVTRGRGSISSSFPSSKGGAQSSHSTSASALALSSLVRSSLASSTGSGDHLDYTGVYRGSANSLEASRNNGAPLKEPQLEAKPEDPPQDASKRMKFDLLAVRLERSTSDSRMMQRQSQLKVEDYFRRTYQQDVKDIDEREAHRWTRRTTRARTTVDDVQEEPHAVGKIIDLKNLRNGVKQLGWHLKDMPVKPQREVGPSRQAAMTMLTFGTTSTGTTATRSMASDLIPMPQNYVISPQATDIKKPKVQGADSRGRGFFSVSSGPGGDNSSPFGAISGRRADNVSLTPTLPRLSAHESPSMPPSLFVTPTEFGGSGEVEKSPVGFAGTSSGFLGKTGSGFNGLKRSAADAPFGDSRASFSQRPTLADRFQSLSASLASTWRRFLTGRSAHQHDLYDVTSPQSQCTAPAALPRDYDQNGFYEAPFKVPGLNKPLQQRRMKTNVQSDRAWARQWLILATCAVLGLSLGAILVRVVVFNASVFNLSADEVHARQERNGELVLAPGVRWLLLPGHLFLRAWSAVAIPLLVCYSCTALADLVGCADKAALVLSFRSLGYALLLALLATIEGVVAMWITHQGGWFRGNSNAATAGAATLSDSIGVTPLPDGAVGLLCTADNEYLKRLGYGVFACSNASLALPLYKEVSMADSSPAVFSLQEVTDRVASPVMTHLPYYPAAFGSGGNTTSSLLSALVPDNIAAQFTRVKGDEMASLCGVLAFSLLLGYVSGKRILRLRREAQAAMFESLQSSTKGANDPHKCRHYIVGVLVELQLALEWIVRYMERYLAPLGFFSVMLGNVVLHHREWRSFTSPMASLVVGVLILMGLHALVVLPLVLMQFTRGRRVPLGTTARAFMPTLLFAFTTNKVSLTAPVAMQCYARVLTVTRSAAQLATAVTAALVRNGRALYLPLLLLWLLETSATYSVELQTSDYVNVGLLSLLSCFCGGSTRLTLAMARTLWPMAASEQSSSAASLLPASMPLLVVCDVILSRVASAVAAVDHLVLTELVAQHWAETYVPESCGNFSPRPSPDLSPLNDSQVPRPPSSGLLSSVYL